MARPVRIECESAIYHVIARGNDRKDIFRDRADRRRYLHGLSECRERFQFAVLAYCLMDNHVHLVLERGPAPLSRIMQTLHSAYAQSFNRRHGRVGHLFQDRYRAFIVEKDRYLVALLRYVHRNPCEAGLVSRPEDYPWSSDRFIRAGRGPRWLDLERLWLLVGGSGSAAARRYREIMEGAGTAAYETTPRFLSSIRGSEGFARQLVEGSQTRQRRIAIGWSPRRVAGVVAAVEGISLGQMKDRRQDSRSARARSIAAFIAWREAAIPVARMAQFFGRDESTLIKGVRRLEMSPIRDGEIRTAIRLMHRESSGVHD